MQDCGYSLCRRACLNVSESAYSISVPVERPLPRVESFMPCFSHIGFIRSAIIFSVYSPSDNKVKTWPRARSLDLVEIRPVRYRHQQRPVSTSVGADFAYISRAGLFKIFAA